MACQKLTLKRCRDGFGNMLIMAFTHHPFLVCILFGMPSLHLYFFDVRPKPKNSSFTTTLELKTALLEFDLDNHSPYEILSPW